MSVLSKTNLQAQDLPKPDDVSAGTMQGVDQGVPLDGFISDDARARPARQSSRFLKLKSKSKSKSMYRYNSWLGNSEFTVYSY